MNYFKEIANLVRQMAADTGLSLPDAAREFLFANSVDASGDWWATYADDPFYCAEQMYKTAIGDPDAETVELLCGNMVDMFSGVCSELGIQKRNVWLYSDYSDTVLGHTYNEIFNEATQKWEIQDANYNIYFIDIRTGARAGVEDMMRATDIEFFVPHNASSSGWSETGADPLRIGNFFAAQMLPASKVLHVSENSLSATLLERLTDTLQVVGTYSTVSYAGDATVQHLTDADAQLAGDLATLSGGAGDDFLSYDGADGSPILAQLSGGLGNDTLALRNTAGQLYGHAGDDILIGGMVGDLLSGGAGADYLAGEAGDDYYLFQLGDGDKDIVDGFGFGHDTILFWDASGIGGAGNAQLSERELGFRLQQSITQEGVLVRYDIDGDGRTDGRFLLEGRAHKLAAGEVRFQFRSDPAPGLMQAVEGAIGSFAESMLGTAGADRIIYDGQAGVVLAGSRTGNDSGNDHLWSRSDANSALYGFDGDDILVSGAGEDYLNGGTGLDILAGGGGDDDYLIALGDGYGDIIETFGDGADEIVFSDVRGFGGEGSVHLSQRELDFRLQQSVTEAGLLVHYDIDGDLEYDGSVLVAGRSTALGSGEVSFAFGERRSEGFLSTVEAAVGRFNGALYGTDGNDKVVYDGSGSVLMAGNRKGMGSGDDLLWSRSDANNAMYGFDGNDRLISGAGEDYLNGGAGIDLLSGGGGADDYIFTLGDGFGDRIETYGQGADEIVFTGASGFGGSGRTQLSELDLAWRLRQTQTEAGLLVDYDVDGDHLFDGSFVLEGRANALGAHEVTFAFKADASAGFLTASEGAVGRFSASLYGTNGNDKAVYSGSGSVLIAGNRSGAGSGDDLLWARSNGNNALYGFDGADTLISGAGADFLSGGAGDDVLTGGAGNDFFAFSANGGSDVVRDFSSADDTLYVYGWSGSARSLTQAIEAEGLRIDYDLNNDGVTDGTIKLVGQTTELGAADLFFG